MVSREVAQAQQKKQFEANQAAKAKQDSIIASSKQTISDNRGFNYESRDRFGNIEGAKQGVEYSYDAQTGQASGPVPSQPTRRPEESRNITVSLSENLGFTDQTQSSYVSTKIAQQGGLYPGLSDYEGIPKNQKGSKNITVSLNERLGISSGPPTQTPQGYPKTEKKILEREKINTTYIPEIKTLERIQQFSSSVRFGTPYISKPVKRLTRGQGRYKGPQSADNIINVGAIGKVNQSSNIFRESQTIRKAPVGIIDYTPKPVLESTPKAIQGTSPYGAAFISGSQVLAKDPTIQNIIKGSTISIKGEAQKIAQRKQQPEVSLYDAKIIPGTIQYAISDNKQPLSLTPYKRELDPLRNRADLIKTVQGPVKNLAAYIIAAPEATKRIIQSGDLMAGEKYFEKEVAPKMQETASSRAFSGDWKALFDPKKLPENIISGATEISMYAFMGGGRIGKGAPTPKSKTPFIQQQTTFPNVPKNAYSTRRMPRDIFKADKAQPSNFRETKINLGKGTGIKFDPSSGGLTIGKTPKGKPPSSFTSTKTELGKGTGKLPTMEIKQKGGQTLLQQTKLEKPVVKQPVFKSYPVRLGQAEAKIVKQIQKQTQQKPYPLQTPKKKKQVQSQSYFQEEFIRYPTTTQKPGLRLSDQIQYKQTDIPKQKTQSFIITEIVNPKQKQNTKFSFDKPLISIVTTKQTPKQKPQQDQAFFFPPRTKTKTTPKFDVPTITKQDFFIPPKTTPTFPQFQQQPQPPRIPPRFPFPPYFPSGFFGSGGYQNPASLKKGYAAFGISSDINIKTLPTYSRYSAGTGVFKAQAKEDQRIQNLFYGKPKRRSKSKKKSRKR